MSPRTARAPRPSRPAGTAALLAAVSVASACLGAPALADATPTARSATDPSPALSLLAPTGRHAVGTTSVHLRDDSRPDPWLPTVDSRELMISLWYPTNASSGQPAQYMTPTESELLLREADSPADGPLDVLSTTRTHAIRDAAPAGRAHSLPLVVLSPGFTKPRSTLTGLAEDLASHGYVVVGVDHTYENVATTFPDGRVTTCVACEEPEKTEAFWQKVDRTRAADVSFVLDELTGAQPTWPGAALINPDRIAMAGHSAGGASTATTMVADPRVRAGVDIDGTTSTPIPETGLSRPFMFLGKPATYTPGSGSEAGTWQRDWNRLTGWKRWLLVTGTVHASFTDVGLLAEQLGVDTGADLPGARATEITRRYLRAFLDLHLRGTPQPLLNRPSPAFPEVSSCTPETATCR